jgi:hypothetical protein
VEDTNWEYLCVDFGLSQRLGDGRQTSLYETWLPRSDIGLRRGTYEMEFVLKHLGGMGWELVSIVPTRMGPFSHDLKAILRRPF